MFYCLLLPSRLLFPHACLMEDRNTLIADCIVISCCCQCLTLQILVFLLVKLPQKLVRKTRDFAKRKLGRRKRGEACNNGMDAGDGWDDEVMVDVGIADGLAGSNSNGCAYSYCCIVEVEKVLEEFSLKGEFAFGSFWGKDQTGSGTSPSPPPAPAPERCVIDMEEVVQFHFIEVGIRYLHSDCADCIIPNVSYWVVSSVLRAERIAEIVPICFRQKGNVLRVWTQVRQILMNNGQSLSLESYAILIDEMSSCLSA